MNRLRTLMTQLRDFLGSLPPARRASFLGMSAAVLAGTFGLLLWVQRPQYAVLFNKLDASDAGIADAARFAQARLSGEPSPPTAPASPT